MKSYLVINVTKRTDQKLKRSVEQEAPWKLRLEPALCFELQHIRGELRNGTLCESRIYLFLHESVLGGERGKRVPSVGRGWGWGEAETCNQRLRGEGPGGQGQGPAVEPLLSKPQLSLRQIQVSWVPESAK